MEDIMNEIYEGNKHNIDHLNKIKRQEKKGDSDQSQWEVNIEHIMA